MRKRKQEEEGIVQDKKKKEEVSQDQRIKDATTPYWNIPYEEQVNGFKLFSKLLSSSIFQKFDQRYVKMTLTV